MEPLEDRLTLVIIKPDTVKRGLIGEVLKLYEQKDLKIHEMKYMMAPREMLEEHYKEHTGKSFYENLLKFMMSGLIIVMTLYGDDVVEIVRKVNGATNYIDADCGSIRGKFAHSVTENCVHGSDSIESAKREIEIWFNKEV